MTNAYAVEIVGNPVLTAIVLPNLTTLASHLYVENNGALTMLDTPLLTSIQGPDFPSRIVGNSRLPNCQAHAVATRAPSPSGWIIRNNKPEAGCP